MPFSSFNFLLVLPLMILSFWALPPRFQKVWLLVLSLFVYFAAGWKDLALLVSLVGLNWAGPAWLGATRDVTTGLIASDLCVLGWFKYRAFFATLAGWSQPMSVVIPLGISFYIFQLIAFQVEVRRGQVSPRTPFFDFFLYIFFFPHHQAGPIMRPHAFLINFSRPCTFFRSRMTTGVLIFLWGLFKKVWIADMISPLVDSQYFWFHDRDGLRGNLWLLGVLYGIQIYGDFSGYSDMAVGLGRIFGFKFDRNFHQPYLARSASEFWSRWHITLSQWLRDFVYLPLGGNRVSQSRMLINLMLVMLLGGLWHGAGWNFLLWGGMHGSLLVLGRLMPDLPGRWVGMVRLLAFQLIVTLTWVAFREPSVGNLINAAGRLSAWWGPETALALVFLAALLAFSQVEQWLEMHFVLLIHRLDKAPFPLLALAYGCLLFIAFIGAGSATTFIYQRF